MASAVLQQVTRKKLAKLVEIRTKFDQQREHLTDVKAEERGTIEYTRRLLHGMKDMNVTFPDDLATQNIRHFLRQAEHDASVPRTTILEWQHKLEALLAMQASKLEYSWLFGQLVTEWLENPNDAAKQLDRNDEHGRPLPLAADEANFESVGRKEMYEQREIWESFAFTERKIDQDALRQYLTSLFDQEKLEKTSAAIFPYLDIRCRMRSGIEPMDLEQLKATITAVINGDLFAGKKRQALLDLQSRDAVLEEMLDCLNMDIREIENWKWDSSGIPVTQRRQMNGKYRFYMDEEIHQALLVHFVGATIGTRFKEAFDVFYDQAWEQKPMMSMTKEARDRRAWFFQQTRERKGNTVADLDLPLQGLADSHSKEYKQSFFLMMMPKEIQTGPLDYNAVDGGDANSPVELKQSLLELVTADMLIRLEAQKDFGVFVSDFKWFGPSMPHQTILAILKFFGLNDKLLMFCKNFLEVPVVFTQDGPGAEPNTRVCGTPISHCLSDTMGEVVTFCLDYAVNKATSGSNIFRLHDDLWFWGDRQSCGIAWSTIEAFAKVTGLHINDEKTGSATIRADGSSDQTSKPVALPEGPVRWGFLKLALDQRRWKIDQTQVEPHILELKLQLDACKSVFAFIQAWNAYVSRFLTYHFGRAANCHGPEHLEAVIATFEDIQRRLFPSANITNHIKDMITSRFGIQNIPAGFLYFPTDLGGLGLQNPLIPLLSRLRLAEISESEDVTPLTAVDREKQQLRRSTPEGILKTAAARDRAYYDAGHRAWEKKRATYTPLGRKEWVPHDAETSFLSFEEFQQYRLETSLHLVRAWSDLRKQPHEQNIAISPAINEHRTKIDKILDSAWCDKTANRWVLELYGPEILQKFGTLTIGNREMLPLGLVNVLKGEKHRWQG